MRISVVVCCPCEVSARQVLAACLKASDASSSGSEVLIAATPWLVSVASKLIRWYCKTPMRDCGLTADAFTAV